MKAVKTPSRELLVGIFDQKNHLIGKKNSPKKNDIILTEQKLKKIFMRFQFEKSECCNKPRQKISG